jgi:phosphoribosylformimino-5-aminoimidazole carboxamide ribotide isomerase
MFRLVFVLDLFNGAVVHAIRGNRELYEPVHLFSTVVQSSDPIDIIEKLEPKEVYLADLNSLTSNGNNLTQIEQISRMTDTMADIGISSLSDIQKLPELCIPVLGTETSTLELIRQMPPNNHSRSFSQNRPFRAGCRA